MLDKPRSTVCLVNL